MIRAVLFDLDDTLVPERSSWKKAFEDEKVSNRLRDRIRLGLYKEQFHDPEKAPQRSFFKMVAPVEYKGGLDGFKTMMAPTAGTGGGVGMLAPDRARRRAERDERR